MKHILAAIDGSDASFRALTHAAELASRLNIDLTILIVRLIVVGRKEIHAALRQEDVQQIEEKARKTALSLGATKAKVVIE